MNKTIAQQLNIKDFPFIIRDKQGNEIYYENFNGYSYKKEYDSKNREISHKDSNGYSWKWEYDSLGNRIYMENSRGEIEENRPKEDEIITLNGKKYKRIEQ